VNHPTAKKPETCVARCAPRHDRGVETCARDPGLSAEGAVTAVRNGLHSWYSDIHCPLARSAPSPAVDGCLSPPTVTGWKKRLGFHVAEPESIGRVTDRAHHGIKVLLTGVACQVGQELLASRSWCWLCLAMATSAASKAHREVSRHQLLGTDLPNPNDSASALRQPDHKQDLHLSTKSRVGRAIEMSVATQHSNAAGNIKLLQAVCAYSKHCAELKAWTAPVIPPSVDDANRGVQVFTTNDTNFLS
jgi:hypothetical protein